LRIFLKEFRNLKCFPYITIMNGKIGISLVVAVLAIMVLQLAEAGYRHRGYGMHRFDSNLYLTGSFKNVLNVSFLE